MLYLNLVVFAALFAPIASFAPASFARLPKMLRHATIPEVDSEFQTTPPQKNLDDAWVLGDFDQSPSDLFQEEDEPSIASSNRGDYDWFSTALQTFSPNDSLADMQVTGTQPQHSMPDSDWFAGALASSVQAPPEPTLPTDDGPSDWFAQAMTSMTSKASLPKQGSAADWFGEAVESGSPVQPADAPSLTKGPSGWFGQSTASEGPFKSIDAPNLGTGCSEWFSEAIKAGAESSPQPMKPRMSGQNEWFSQNIATDVPAPAQVSRGLPLGSSEWFTCARPTTISTYKMTPHEWFSVCDAPEYNPDLSASGTGITKDAPHEWFMHTLGGL